MAVRNDIVKFIEDWSSKTELPIRNFLLWLNLFPGRFYTWKTRKKVGNCHNGLIPKKHWLLAWERQAIINYAKANPNEGYRRMTFMMLDENVVAVSPSSVYRILKSENLLDILDCSESSKGTGFTQPTKAHEHWHIDISYINIACTYYYLCSILDGFSRYIVHWELRERMREADIEITLQHALEIFPGAKPRIISDNGPQFIAKDFKEYVRLMEMTHVTTSPYYPQSNGKLERYHRTIKSECVRQNIMVDLSFALSQIRSYVEHYNTKRLHSAIGYITPQDKLRGNAVSIFAARKSKLKQAQTARLNA
jgi:transposase InsO family protein